MAEHRADAGASVDPVLALGEFAALLADRSALPAALAALRASTGADGVVLRDDAGAVLAGDPDLPGRVVELPVLGRSGARLGTLSVSGSHAADLPLLRGAAAVLGLALVPAADYLESEHDALADALHDGPVQSLVVARYASDAAVRGGDAAAARDAVQHALVDVRRFLWHLRPRGSNGLVGALEQLSHQLVEAGGEPIGLLGEVEVAALLRGAPAVLTYRLVQALAGPQNPPVRVLLRTEGNTLLVDIDTSGELPAPDRWERRTRALGGELTTTAGRIRLALPHPETRTSS